MPKTLRIGLCVGPDDPYWVLVREAIYQCAEESSVYLVHIEAPDTWDFPGPLPVNWVDELLAQELDALITKDLPPQVCLQVLESGLPVIYAAESEIQHPRFSSPFMLYQAAQMIGHYLAERLSGAGSVLIVGGEENYSPNRVDGIREALGGYPGIRQHFLPGPWDYNQAYTSFQATLRALPGPVNALFGTSDSMALAARDAGRMVGMVDEKTLITGVNGDLLALAAIAEGSMAATVEISATNLGSRLVELACQAAQGQTLPTHFAYDLTLVTADTVTEIMKQKLVAIAGLPTRLIGVDRQREQKRLAQLETSLEVNRRIGSTLERQQLLLEIADLIRKHYRYDQVYLYLWLDAEQVFVLEQLGKSPTEQRRLPLSQAGLLRHALSSNEPIFLPDAQHSSRFPPDAEHPETCSRVVLPFRLGETLLGLLDLHSYQPTQHTRHELVGLQLLADQLGLAMRNAELYAEAVKARAIAEKADQLKTRLLANVSHELRAPLNVILGYSETALASQNSYGIELPAMMRRDLTQIYRSGEHLMRLINDLLDLSRAEIGELSLTPETIAPRFFLEDVFQSFSRSVSSEKISWLLYLPERLPLIVADTVRLRQILLNLLTNAHKFTPEGHILLGAAVEPPYLHIWVEDTGVGIPVEQQKRIFEPFVTLERLGRRNEGIGLGLSMARRLVALHRGFMTLESQVGQGSTFHVYFPLPSLSNQSQSLTLPMTGQTVILVISSQAHPCFDDLRLPPDWRPLILRPTDNLEQGLGKVQPMALVWDFAHATASDWGMIQQIRNHPQLYQLPFILLGCEQDQKFTASPTGVLTKPLGGQTLLAMLDALRPSEAPGSILIVDDDPQACELYQRIVSQAIPGCPIQVAQGGVEALAALSQAVPALVILDLVMPEVDGFSVLAQLRADQRTYRVPVLVISGHVLSDEDIRRLDHAQVIFQSKDILSDAETVSSLRRALSHNDRLPQPTSTLVKQAIAFIQQNYAVQNLSRQQIAQAIGISEDYLGRIFQHELGLGPIEYLNRYRIKEAKTCLIHTSDSVTEIAFQVGFDDPAYFSRVFHKQVGLSPRTFRKR